MYNKLSLCLVLFVVSVVAHDTTCGCLKVMPVCACCGAFAGAVNFNACLNMIWDTDAHVLAMNVTLDDSDRPILTGKVSMDEPTLCTPSWPQICVHAANLNIRHDKTTLCPRITASLLGVDVLNHTFTCLHFRTPILADL